MAIPSEHGGWSLTLEPVVLGLIVAPSSSGFALGLCALLAFLARTPLKLAVGDRWRGRRLERTGPAERVAAIYVLLLLVALALGIVLAQGGFWLPLMLAAPLVAVEFWFDVRSRSRRLLPELAGTVGIGAVAAAIVLAGGAAGAAAAGAWVVVAARAIATIPFVRLQLRRAKRQSHSVARSDLAQALALVLTLGGLGVGWVPMPAVAAVAVLGAVQVWLARLAVPKTAVIGAQQVVLGLAVVLVAGLAIAAP